jgi:hypothetical protein
MSEDLVYRLRKRAEIRRQITTRKSVQNNEPDRIADLLEEASSEIERLRELEERIKYLEGVIESALGWVQAFDRQKPFTDLDACGEMVKIRLTGLCILATAIGKRDYDAILKKASEK